MAHAELTLTEEEIRGLFRGDRGVAQLLERVLNEVLEAETADHLGAEPHERTDGRRGWRNGHYDRSLTTRVGTLQLRVPRDREGTFRTELFQRYQRSANSPSGWRSRWRRGTSACWRGAPTGPSRRWRRGWRTPSPSSGCLTGTCTTNALERLIQAVRRRERVIRIFPNEASAHRLLGAYLAETHEEWAAGRRYFRMDDYFNWRAERDGVPIREAAA